MATQPSAGLGNKIFAAFEQVRKAPNYVRIRTQYNVL
jgi:ribosomal protein L39E